VATAVAEMVMKMVSNRKKMNWKIKDLKKWTSKLNKKMGYDVYEVR